MRQYDIFDRENTEDESSRAIHWSWNTISLPSVGSQTTALAKMSSEQRLSPIGYLRNPLVKHEQGRYPTERQDTQKECDQPPWGNV